MSLSDQLKSISDNATSVVVDRKSRSKIHSRSLIFEPKIAATQDYELIYDIALEGLDELIEFNKKFSKFKGTLFHDNTVTFDRNVQQPDMLKSINENINNFLLLISPYLNLNCSVKALEWLVRRFNINLYNGEMMLLVGLSYYKDPIFIKFLNVIPKSSFPKIFESLVGFKDLLKNPSMISILKNFLNNFELFKLYTLFVVDQIKNKLIFKDQLIFYLSISIQLLSTISKDQIRIENQYLPILLNLVGTLLLPNNVNSIDCKLTAYSLISVISSIIPLNSKIISSLTDTIINNKECLNQDIIKKTIITLGQLWQNFIPETNDSQLSIKYFTIDEELIKSLISENYNMNKFLIYYFVSNLDQLSHFRFFKYLKIDDELNFKYVLNKLLENSTTTDKITKENVTKSLESIYKLNSEFFKKYTTIKIPDLEMILMTTLDNEVEADIEEEIEEDMEVDDIEEIIETEISTNLPSFFINTSNNEFQNVSKVLMVNLNSIENFQTKFPSFESYLSFLIRFSLTTSFPILARLKVLSKLNKILNKYIKNDGINHEYYLLLPIILIGLYDSNKIVRQHFLNLLNIIKTSQPNKKPTLFMEDQIYNELPNNKKSLLPPKDGNFLLSITNELGFEDLIIDNSKILEIMNKLFNYSKSNSKKFGSTFIKSFILNQWSLNFLPLTFKSKIWEIMKLLNQQNNDYRSQFNDDLINYLPNRSNIMRESNDMKLSFENIETNLIGLIGGLNINEKFATKEVDLILNLININPKLVSQRLITFFPKLKYNDLKFKIFNKLIDLLVEDNNNGIDIDIDFDPFEILSSFNVNFELISSVLKTVQINNQVPDQANAKRKRRSSSQTKQNLARNDITNIASLHLKKLTIVLDLLDYNLTENLKGNSVDQLSCPELLIELFKILTDLDYLGNDGHLPILYAQETLANCMSNAIKLMKFKDFKYDSNSIRADLIVNSIRNSTSPQVQNRLLLVIAELASLAPEIILHSVMPIFTFMGAHTIKQDDEFSNSALQETVSRVIPALAQNGTTNIDEDIEFLLASFVAALQHIPRHRRNKLFSSLVKTLTVEKSLHVILFLVGNQYNKEINAENKDSLIEFSSILLKNFSPKEQLQSIDKFLKLWETIPNKEVTKNSDLYNELIKRPIFGASTLALTDELLVDLKVGLFDYLNEIISPKDEFNEINLLKLKIGIELLDDQNDESNKKPLLDNFNNIISFLLKLIDSDKHFIDNLYQLLNNFLDMLPISYFIDSIIDSIKPDSDLKIARNFVNLTASKFENELNINNANDEIISTIISKLLPAFINGIDKNVDLLLQQSYLDGLSIIINKLFVIDNGIFNDTKQLIKILNIVISDKGLLSNKPELIISSINLINNIINVLGIKSIGFFPKIINPSFKIWKDFETEELVQTSILLLYSSLIKKLSAFLGNNLDNILLVILKSSLVNNDLRANILDLIIKHVELSKVLKSLCNIWINNKFYENDLPENLGLYLNCLINTIDNIDKKSAINNSTIFLRWLIKSLEFRYYCEINDKFNNNTIFRLESSFHKCGINYIMKLNDKKFRPLFASLTRWTIDGEDSIIDNELLRYISFFKFFNKLQEELKSIITSYYSYLIEPVAKMLGKFNSKEIEEVNLRRILLISLNSSFKYDQDDYWSQESRFEMISNPLIDSLHNIEDPIGKYLLKSITSFTANVSSDEYNNIIVKKLITFLSDDNSVHSKVWTIRTLKSIFQKVGETWLTFLPTLVPYIAELLEDDDESVELEVRKGLVRVIESVLGEPLDRYLD